MTSSSWSSTAKFAPCAPTTSAAGGYATAGLELATATLAAPSATNE
ncbi:MAG TPA: hypothetical protein VEH55_11000 [Gaiellaceae bacterium]|nr:hypothetical protein [Gaiellaceae bacterium]